MDCDKSPTNRPVADGEHSDNCRQCDSLGAIGIPLSTIVTSSARRECRRTQVCCSQDEVLETGEDRKAVMLAEGWQ